VANQRNLATLEQLLGELDPEGRCFGPGGPARAARWLAAHGVLASDCVTDDDARRVLERAVPLVPAGTALRSDAAWLRPALQQIAAGEP
jgi:hypothetical protein